MIVSVRKNTTRRPRNSRPSSSVWIVSRWAHRRAYWKGHLVCEIHSIISGGLSRNRSQRATARMKKTIRSPQAARQGSQVSQQKSLSSITRNKSSMAVWASQLLEWRKSGLELREADSRHQDPLMTFFKVDKIVNKPMWRHSQTNWQWAFRKVQAPQTPGPFCSRIEEIVQMSKRISSQEEENKLNAARQKGAYRCWS